MLTARVSESAYQDLLITESNILSAQHQITRRAEIYLATGALTFDRMLEAVNDQLGLGTRGTARGALHAGHCRGALPSWVLLSTVENSWVRLVL